MTEELHEKRLDKLHIRLVQSSTIDDVIRDVEYEQGQLDFLLHVNNEKVYLEYKCTDGYSQRRCARGQIYRAIENGVVDYGLYVAGPMHKLRAMRIGR